MHISGGGVAQTAKENTHHISNGGQMKASCIVLLSATLLAASIVSCKKDAQPTNATNNTGQNCNFTTDVVVVDGATNAIVQPMCHVLGSSYFAEFLTNTSAAPTGIAMIFSGSTRPSAGSYSIITDVNQLAAGKVFVEYYDPANSWIGTTGTITVAASGSQAVITFCSLTLTGVGNKVVSVRATTNL
jgi:hypothetical protein